MGSDRGNGDDNVVSIFDRVAHQDSRSHGLLESHDPEFQILVERFLNKFGSQKRASRRSKDAAGIAIMQYETTDQMDLLIKFAILEIVLGYGPSSAQNHNVHENLMCIYFKKSMIDVMENRLTAAR